jgi:hypothetical protein
MVVANVKKPIKPAKQAVVAEGRVVGKPGVVVGAKAVVPAKEEQRRRRRLLGKCCVLCGGGGGGGSVPHACVN